ncbi:unnamed protein product, partial [Brenthis ino]
MESIKESLSALTDMFNARMHEFQQDLSKASTPASSSVLPDRSFSRNVGTKHFLEARQRFGSAIVGHEVGASTSSHLMDLDTGWSASWISVPYKQSSEIIRAKDSSVEKNR